MSTKRNPDLLSTEWLRGKLAALIPDSEGKHFKLAYSGGMDSHVLLHLLAGLSHTRNWRLTAIHVDHGLLPQSGEWARHCAGVCKDLGVPLVIETVHVQSGEKGPEHAAREARYQALAEHVSSDDILITAHHRDDQVETVLLHLVRGTGAHGLAGMAPVRVFASGLHIRPLLDVSRHTINEYADSQQLQWVEDASNENRNLGRNYMRHEIVPKFRAHWPGADTVIGRSAGHAAAAVELLQQIAREDWQQCGQPDDMSLSLAACASLSDVRLQNLLRYWVVQSGLPLPSTQHLDEVLRQIRHPSATGMAIIHWPGANCCRYRDQITLRPLMPGITENYDIYWDTSTPLTIDPLGLKFSATRTTGRGLALAALGSSKIHLRNRRGGEELRPVGRSHRHKLKKLFQEAGIPPWQRDLLPLVFVNDSLAAVGDRWLSQEFAAQENEPGLELNISKL